MLLGVVYMASIFMVEVVAKPNKDNSEIQAYFGTLPAAMITMFQVSTWEDWSTVVEVVDRQMPGLFVFFLFFVIVSGLGILNLVAGVMVMAAFKVVQKDEAFRKKQMLTELKKELLDAKQRLVDFLDVDPEAETNKEQMQDEKDKKEENEEKEEKKGMPSVLRRHASNLHAKTKNLFAKMSANTEGEDG